MTNKPKRTREEKIAFIQQQLEGIKEKEKNLAILKQNLETKLLNLQNVKTSEAGEGQ